MFSLTFLTNPGPLLALGTRVRRCFSTGSLCYILSVWPLGYCDWVPSVKSKSAGLPACAALPAIVCAERRGRGFRADRITSVPDLDFQECVWSVRPQP